MRFAIIAAAGASASADPRLGERDAMLVRSRLELDDLGFEVAVVDPGEDLAVQIEEQLALREGQIDDLLIYASCLLAVLDDGECYLCLNPDEPDVGDALADVIEVVSGRALRATLLVADLRHDDADADRAMLGEALDAFTRIAAGPDSGVELIAAIRPVRAHAERIPSRLTAGLLEAIDDRVGPLSARQAYATLIQRADLGSWPHVVGHRHAKEPFPLRDPSTDMSLTSTLASEGVPPAPEAQGDVAPEAQGDLVPEAQGDVAPEAQEADVDVTPPAAEPPAPEADVEVAPAAGVAVAAEVAAEVAPASLGGGRDGAPPAPMSERIESTSTTVPQRKKPKDPVSMPKVVIGKSDPPKDEAREPEPPSARSGRRSGRMHQTAAEGPAAKRLAADAAAAMAMLRAQQAEEARAAEGAADAPAEDGEDISIEEEISIEEHVPKTITGSPPPPPTLRKKAAEMTVDDHVEAGDLARSLHRDEEAVAHYKKGLAKLGTAATPERAAIYLRIAEVFRRTGKTRLAISNYDKALSITPSDREALAGLIELNAAANNWRSVHSAEQKFLAGVPAEEKLGELLASGDRWFEQADDLRRAKERYSEARAAFPNELEPLRRLLRIYDREKSTELALETRKAIATLTPNPRESARCWFELGELYMFELRRERDALEAFEQALDADPMMLEALEVLATALADGQEWGELERVYDKMVAKFASREQTDATKTVLGELFHRSALLYRDHLEDPEHALAALENELMIRPRSLAARIMACELSVELEDGARALDHLRAAAELEPRRAETYHQLFALGQRFEAQEIAFMAASVADVLGVADDRERIVYRELRVEGVPVHAHALGPEEWALLRHKGRDTSVEDVMRAVAPAVLRTRIAQLEHKRELVPLPEDKRHLPESSTVSAVRSINWAWTYLGGPELELYVMDQYEGAFIAPFAKRQSTIIGKDALRGRTLRELAFLAGRHVAMRFPEHELVAHLRTADELTVCFLAAVKIVLGGTPVRGEQGKVVDALAELLVQQQTPEEREALEKAVRRFDAAGGRVGLKRWIKSVELCAHRAGFVLCGDLETAVSIIRSEGSTAFVDVDTRLDDLFAFAVSQRCAQLRKALGSGLAPEDDEAALSAV